ncbi:MAG TPA: DNA topoisomerase IV subunit A [Rickettsiales bacterium]|nr:DNA topoisomerase IV subunit A [Rickettsiales bacterium]
MKPEKSDNTPIITDVSFKDAISERYLAYALSTIMSRSLPDVRDGLKPVHRRLLYAMLQLKLDPKSGFKKCARVVGDVIGKYHPHGDTAVYDTLVRLAQSFAVRYPLVEGQGNFGSIDGDNAAAMRYTEARLTDVAVALLAGIDQDTVDFRPTYDGEDHEPIVLPASFPNLLANGSEGIAVGMATSIPPHNVGELCDALIYLIQHPNASVAKLMEFVKGPDFPTGGIVVEPHQNILQAYETGRGSFRVRARWEKEQLSHGLYQIVVTEIPYQVQKSRLIEKIAELFKNKKLPFLGNIRDESTEEIRIVLEPKNRQIDADMLMESLFKVTDLETRFNMNMNVLTGGNMPQVLNLREVLLEFFAHRDEVVLRRTKYRLEKIAHRLEVLGGLLIAYLNLDEVIKLIREEDEPKPKMMKRWKLTDVQAEAILNMRLRSLRKLDEIEIRQENDNLLKEQEELNEIANSDEKRAKVIAKEIKEIKKAFGEATEIGRRRTEFADAPAVSVISIEALVEKEPITIICSKMGWIRAVKGHTTDLSDIKYKEGDEGKFFIFAQTTDKLLLFATDGKFFTIPCDKISRGKGHGDPVRLFIELGNEHDIVDLSVFVPEVKFLVASDAGRGFVVKSEDVVASTKNGKQILNTVDKGRALALRVVDGDSVAVIGDNRKLLIFPISEIPEMTRGQGVALQKYKGGSLADVKIFNQADGLSWKSGERVRTEEDIKPWLGHRGTAGRLPPTGFPRSNLFE